MQPPFFTNYEGLKADFLKLTSKQWTADLPAFFAFCQCELIGQMAKTIGTIQGDTNSISERFNVLEKTLQTISQALKA